MTRGQLATQIQPHKARHGAVNVRRNSMMSSSGTSNAADDLLTLDLVRALARHGVHPSLMMFQADSGRKAGYTMDTSPFNDNNTHARCRT